jgi:hypothetical protein
MSSSGIDASSARRNPGAGFLEAAGYRGVVAVFADEGEVGVAGTPIGERRGDAWHQPEGRALGNELFTLRAIHAPDAASESFRTRRVGGFEEVRNTNHDPEDVNRLGLAKNVW